MTATLQLDVQPPGLWRLPARPPGRPAMGLGGALSPVRVRRERAGSRCPFSRQLRGCLRTVQCAACWTRLDNVSHAAWMLAG